MDEVSRAEQQESGQKTKNKEEEMRTIDQIRFNETRATAATFQKTHKSRRRANYVASILKRLGLPFHLVTILIRHQLLE
jgi:hypothetical protein